MQGSKTTPGFSRIRMGLPHAARFVAAALLAGYLMPGFAEVAGVPLAPGQPGRYAIGTPATEKQIESWNTDIAPDGNRLPKGEGTIEAGRQLYAAQCASCHGAKGEGGLGDRLAGGAGTLASAKPIRTVGSYWPYATTLYDYIRRAMPLNAPRSLSDEEVYSISGYVLSLNGLMAEQGKVDAAALLAVKMPNRDGFVEDPRPDVGPAARAAR
jgi:mono/diheme cytochrome c family protein